MVERLQIMVFVSRERGAISSGLFEVAMHASHPVWRAQKREAS
jgi:hypothetical protein